MRAHICSLTFACSNNSGLRNHAEKPLVQAAGWLDPAQKNAFTLDLDFHGGGWIGLYLRALWIRAGLPKQQLKTRHNSISYEEQDVYLLSDQAFLNRQEEFRRNANEETVNASKDLLFEELFALQVKEYPELKQAARELAFLWEVQEGWAEGAVAYMDRSWWLGVVAYIYTTKCTIRQSVCRSKVWASRKSH
jgi:hypothetical protein